MSERPETERLPKTSPEAETALGEPGHTAAYPTGGPPNDTYAAPPVMLSSRYDILGELGKGGMGVVYKARDRETGELLALKVLRPEVAARPEIADRFVSELRLARQITHKNVCRIFDFNRIAGVACISMELVEGESLRHVLERFGNLSIRSSVRIATQMCAALREAHAQGIVHRDMKPENVMLTTAGDAKVMDFGIAQSMKGGAEDSGISGTPAYMSPEQAQGQPTDARSDIYAVGMILYEMLSGSLPFKGKTALDLAQRGEEVTPQPLRELEPSVPAHLERVAMRCLQRDPARRYQTIGELESALRSDTASAMEAFDLPAPDSLRRPHWLDAVLALVAIVGLLAFPLTRDSILPASNDKLQVEAVTAKREAERIIRQFGYNDARTIISLEYRGADYQARVLEALQPFRPDVARARGKASEIVERLRALSLPLFWRIEFGQLGWADAGGEPAGHVLLDRQGKAVEYVRHSGQDIYLPQYKPLATEERRRIATAAAEQFCGVTLKDPPRTELSGGESGASYTAVWRPLHTPFGTLPVARVVLWADAPYEISCAPAFPMPESDLAIAVRGFFHTLGFAMVAGALIGLLFRFGSGRYHESPLIARRAPLALLLGATTAWMAQVQWLGTVLSLPLTIAATLVAALTWLIALVTVEHRLLRYAPEKLAAWSALMRGRVFAPEVAFAFVRGACVGLGLLAVQTALAYWTVYHRAWIMLGVPDPGTAVRAVTTALPALYTVAAVLVSTFVIGFVAAGMVAIVRARRREKRRRMSRPIRIVGGLLLCYFVAGGTFALFYTSQIAFGQTLAGAVVSFTPGIMLLLVCFTILRYDLLTATFAAATATLFTVNTTAMWLLEDLGNATQVGLFVAWGGVVLFATAIAYRQRLFAAFLNVKSELG